MDGAEVLIDGVIWVTRDDAIGVILVFTQCEMLKRCMQNRLGWERHRLGERGPDALPTTCSWHLH